MWEYAIKGFTVLMLGITAIQDIRWKKVRVAIVWAAALLICLCIPFSSRMPVIERLLGVISGLGVVLLSKITGGKIGLGDGLVLAVTGMGLGFWGNIELFALALARSGVFHRAYYNTQSKQEKNNSFHTVYSVGVHVA